MAPWADRHLAYLFNNQIAEADLVCFSKADLYTQFPELPVGPALRLSSTTGQGVSEWLDEILDGTRMAGSRVLQDPNYQQYAERRHRWVGSTGKRICSSSTHTAPQRSSGPVWTIST